MTYRCNTCHFKGKTFPSGACPACDSKNISREKRKTHEEENHKNQSRNLKSKLILLIVWLLFAYAIYDFIQK